MMFKVDFAKAYDSVRWDYLDDVLRCFGFSSKWRSWISGSLNSGMVSILVNGSPTAEFPFHCGLKINIMKSNLLGVGVSREVVSIAARNIGCLVMSTPFKYLGVMKQNTLSIGGRLTLLKSVLDSTPIYAMSLYKTPKSVLHSMESIRRKFFYGANDDIKKITWISWSKVLGAKDKRGLGVSSLYGLNRALLFKWVWRFLSKDNSLWSRVIYSIHGDYFSNAVVSHSSLWKSISREIDSIKSQGIDLISHFRIRVGNDSNTKFWKDHWIDDKPLCQSFPRMYALENSKDCYVADKFNGSLMGSFRRIARGGIEEYRLNQLRLLKPVILSPSEDRWVWILSNDDGFRVKDIRRLLDDFFLPKSEVATRWVKCVPIKINVFAWRVSLDRLPTRLNLIRRNISVLSPLCSVCSNAQEDVSHLLYNCDLASGISRLVCRWWDLTWSPLSSNSEWLSWFKYIRLPSKTKDLLEGVFYISWWSVWNFRNHLLFSAKSPRKDVIFDDIVTRSFTWCHSRCN
nr:RNA-directed DNA polymerase, eukaryota [Tanacetum cinerariifolium]